jgi:hypothetical protein
VSVNCPFKLSKERLYFDTKWGDRPTGVECGDPKIDNISIFSRSVGCACAPPTEWAPDLIRLVRLRFACSRTTRMQLTARRPSKLGLRSAVDPAPIGRLDEEIHKGNQAMKIPRSDQLYFFLMPDEIKLTLKFIANQNCAIYPDRMNSPVPCNCGIQCDAGLLFFCPLDLSSRINTYKIGDEIYTIDRTTSPIVEFSPSYLRAKSLSRGRLYFHGGYDGREQWVAHPENLYLTYRKVAQFMKRTLLTSERQYLGYLSEGTHLFVSQGCQLDQF